ncbi:MAG: hypothetical protein KR126chlam6_00753 [Candidatus Anoxychlamydiales bacterium]|nr:hypothetical protein [Candidatus Anoxychlamydiales bacterium]
MASAVAPTISPSSISLPPVVQEFEKKYEEEKNETSYFKELAHWIQTTLGIKRACKFVANGVKWPQNYAKELNLDPKVVKTLFNVETGVKSFSKKLIIMKYPSSISNLNDCYNDYMKADKKNSTRKMDKLAKQVFDFISDSATLIQLGELFGLYVLGTVIGAANILAANFFHLLYHTMNLKIGSEDYKEHNQMYNQIENPAKLSNRIKTIFNETKNLDNIKLTKTITAIALSCIMITELSLGLVLLPATMILLFATVANVFSIWAHFYEKSMTYQPVSK